jgi:hypothetical protein
VCVIRPWPGDARRDHVAVADRLDLLDLVAVDKLVEACEEPIEEPDHLARVESVRERGEVDDIRRPGRAWPSFAAFVATIVLALALSEVVRPNGADLPNGFVRTFDVLNIVVVSLVAMLLLVTFARGRDTAQARVETLLLNVLPAEVAQRLQSDPKSIADHFDDASILFASKATAPSGASSDHRITELDSSRPPSMTIPRAGATRIKSSCAVRRKAKLRVRANTARLIIDPVT